jgi:DNA-directed RNA polymerase specialized sigma24 family protein/CheY-like chemotaxis protein
MSIARSIAPHLPHLRRFARALEGAQAGGDAFVAATLESLIADPSSFPKDAPPRVALYRLFVRIWSSTHRGEKPLPASGLTDALRRNLDALPPASRQAFLLHTVEEFSLDEVATVLRVSRAEAERLLDAAGREIASQVATSVLIIEDEPIIALDLESLVRDLGHEVTGIARTRREAVEMVKARAPGLVLADIQLADGSSGLDAVNDILAMIEAPVIFITAFPERLLTGEKPEPAFLITKPFRPETVKATISQALFFDRKAGRKAE